MCFAENSVCFPSLSLEDLILHRLYCLSCWSTTPIYEREMGSKTTWLVLSHVLAWRLVMKPWKYLGKIWQSKWFMYLGTVTKCHVPIQGVPMSPIMSPLQLHMTSKDSSEHEFPVTYAFMFLLKLCTTTKSGFRHVCVRHGISYPEY